MLLHSKRRPSRHRSRASGAGPKHNDFTKSSRKGMQRFAARSAITRGSKTNEKVLQRAENELANLRRLHEIQYWNAPSNRSHTCSRRNLVYQACLATKIDMRWTPLRTSHEECLHTIQCLTSSFWVESRTIPSTATARVQSTTCEIRHHHLQSITLAT
jgi:hypothetical protein